MFRMLLFGYLCQHRGRIVPSAAFCLSSLPEEKRDEWEMSQAGPQQLLTAFCPLWSEHQQPLLLLGVSPSGNVHVGLGWFPSSCVPDVHQRRACGGAFTGATKLVPHAGQGCSNRRFKAALGDRSPAATLGTLVQNSPMFWPEMVGSRETLCN